MDFGPWAGEIYYQPFLSYRHREEIGSARDLSMERGNVKFLMLKAHDENHVRLWKSAADMDKILDEFSASELDRVIVEISKAIGAASAGN